MSKKTIKKIDFVKPSLDIKDNIKAQTITEEIKEKLKDIQNIQDYKNDINFLNLICNLIENSVFNRSPILGRKKSRPTNKKEAVIDIVTKLFEDESDEYKAQLDKQIEYLHHHKLIKKVSIGLVTAYYVYDWINRKVL